MSNAKEINSAYQYEFFVNRIYKTDKRLARANKQEFSNLILIENDSLRSISPNYDRQSKIIKQKIERALEILYSLDLTDNEKNTLPILLSLNAQAVSVSDFVIIIQKGLQLTNRFK